MSKTKENANLKIEIDILDIGVSKSLRYWDIKQYNIYFTQKNNYFLLNG